MDLTIEEQIRQGIREICEVWVIEQNSDDVDLANRITELVKKVMKLG